MLQVKDIKWMTETLICGKQITMENHGKKLLRA